MIYTVVCTDFNDYANWQCELLEYSWSRVKQPGKLVRLVSCEADAVLPIHRHAEVVRTRPTNTHPESGDFYPPYNRIHSLNQWLEENNINGTVLIVDCDVIFRSPLKTKVREGFPVAQHWLDYGVSDAFREAINADSDVDVDTLQAATWPALIHSGDLRRILPRWIEITQSIREQIHRQESDMFAFLAASRELDIDYELGTTTAFMPWPDKLVPNAPLVHYCQPVNDHDGAQLWYKQGYHPWDSVAGADRAELPYCRDLLHLINEYAAIKETESRHKKSTIFVALASYCEPELVDTIESCLSMARYPENIRFGICHQYDNSDPLTDEKCLDRYSQDTRMRYVLYDYHESQGGCWARNIAQQLYQGETYTLQIDSHSRLIESWDTILIGMLESLPAEKPLITQFPPLYYFKDDEVVFDHIENLTQVNTAIAADWPEEGWIHHPQKLIPENDVFPRRTRFLSGAFVFTSGDWNETVRQDPQHFYTGEEFALALRSYTHGYDLFDPNQIVVWHRLHPRSNRKFWDDNKETTVGIHHNTALHRLRLLLDGDPENELTRYGLGTERTLEDFRLYSGLDCSNRSIHPDARDGVPPDPATIGRTKQHSDPADPGQLNNQAVDVTILMKHMAPLLLTCKQNNPVLLMLFQALHKRSGQPDETVYLNLGPDGQQQVFFKLSQMVAIETQPPLGEAFLNQLAAESRPES